MEALPAPSPLFSTMFEKDFKCIIKKASFPNLNGCYILNALFADNGMSKIGGKNFIRISTFKILFLSSYTGDEDINY